MQITRISSSGPLDLQIDGRLDSYWANHLDSFLAEAVREGHDRVRLDLSEVVFLSSAGIRVLIRFYKKLAGIQGMLSVTSPSEPVRTVLEIAGLAAMLIENSAAAPANPSPAPAAETPATVPTIPATATAGADRLSPVGLELPGVHLQVYDMHPGAQVRCSVIGNPAPLRNAAFTEADAATVKCEADLVAVGMGAFGGNFAECRERFGELLIATGAVAYMPSDGTSIPDYLLGAGAVPPEASVLYGLACKGAFAHMARFDPPARDAVVPLSALAAAALELAQAPAAALVIVGEVSGLVGASLRRSPAQPGATADLFEFPGVRSWLSFTAERAFARSQALVVGIVARAEDNGLPAETLAQLRPIGSEPGALLGHFHAATFPFRPLRKGPLELRETVETLFSSEALLGLLHLLHDERPLLGAGQSEFVRGACWASPLAPSSTSGN